MVAVGAGIAALVAAALVDRHPRPAAGLLAAALDAVVVFTGALAFLAGIPLAWAAWRVPQPAPRDPAVR